MKRPFLNPNETTLSIIISHHDEVKLGYVLLVEVYDITSRRFCAPLVLVFVAQATPLYSGVQTFVLVNGSCNHKAYHLPLCIVSVPEVKRPE
jgi:hypothetical protein